MTCNFKRNKWINRYKVFIERHSPPVIYDTFQLVKKSYIIRAVFTWLSKGIGFGFGFTTPFGWLVYLLWFWFYDSQVKTALIGSKSSTSRTDAVRVNDKNAKNQNASWKRWVLSEALETVADDDCLMFNGNLFHLFYSFGPATEYLWPNKQSMWTYGPKYRVFRTEHTEYVDIWSYRLDIQTMH